MANIRYEIPENESTQAMAAESAPSYDGVTIPVTVPNIGGYTMSRLKEELTQIALRLVSESCNDEYKMSMEELDAKIQKGVEDYRNGRVIRKLQTESSEDFLNRLCTM